MMLEIRYTTKNSHGYMIIDKEFVIRKVKKFKRLFKGCEFIIWERDEERPYLVAQQYNSFDELVKL